MCYSVPNQRMVRVHRERATSNFLGIKNENWQAAARDLGPYALTLYLYFAANANGYLMAFSPTAVNEAIGMPASTARDQFKKLVAKGYIVPTNGNSFEFYETSQTRPAVHPSNSNESRYSTGTAHNIGSQSPVNNIEPNNIEINNKDTSSNRINIGSSPSSIEVSDTSKEFKF